MCKSNNYAIHLKLIQCCQLLLNKIARKQKEDITQGTQIACKHMKRSLGNEN